MVVNPTSTNAAGSSKPRKGRANHVGGEIWLCRQFQRLGKLLEEQLAVNQKLLKVKDTDKRNGADSKGGHRASGETDEKKQFRGKLRCHECNSENHLERE